jgi:thiamine biosynthesis protein ThiS
LTITVNGDPCDVPGPVSVTALLESLAIDARRVAVEHNLVILKRVAFDNTIVHEGDTVEIVNFVGGGQDEGSNLGI